MARHQSENQAVARWTGLGNTDGCIGIENPHNTPIRPKGAELFLFHANATAFFCFAKAIATQHSWRCIRAPNSMDPENR